MHAIGNYLRANYRVLVACLVVGFFLAFTGALGSDEAPALNRYLFWMVTMTLGGIVGSGVSYLVDRFTVFAERPIAYTLATALAVSVPMTAIVTINLMLLFPGFRLGGSTLFLFGIVLVISLGMSALGLVLEKGQDFNPPAAAAPTGAQATALAPTDPYARLRERLPPRIRAGAIWALEAEDHYVRVHTSVGDDLILMRLSDATALLDAVEGLQIHRSWWVARAGVERVGREDGRVVVTLRDGKTAPVARARVAEIRASGWA